MKKLSKVLLGTVCLFSLTIGFSSCVGTQTLYNWDKYENVSYAYTKEPNEKNENNLLKCYDKMFEMQGKSYRKVVPPGLCAEKAYMLLKARKKEEAMKDFDLEIKNYPESKLFIDRIKKQLEQ